MTMLGMVFDRHDRASDWARSDYRHLATPDKRACPCNTVTHTPKSYQILPGIMEQEGTVKANSNTMF